MVRTLLLITLAGLAALQLSGCAVFKPQREQVARAEARIGPGKVTPDAIQSTVMSFADDHRMRLEQAMDEIAMERLESRPRGQLMYVVQNSRESAVLIAAGPNPVASLIDMLVMLTLSADAMEGYLPGVLGDEKAAVVVGAFRRSEEQAWAWSGEVLAPEQQDDLRASIQEWQASNPGQYFVSHVRFQDFAAFRRVSPTADDQPRNVLGLFYLDPLASLDPASQEIARSRLLAERAMFYAQRLPWLVSGEANLFYNDMLGYPSVQGLLEDATRVSDATAKFAEVAEQLPDQLSAEREAAIDQASERLGEQSAVIVDQMADRLTVEREAAIEQMRQAVATEREALLASLDTEEARLRGVLTELRGAIDSGTELSASVAATVASIDTLTARLAANKDPDAKPLDMEQLGVTLAHATETSRELNALVGRVDALMASPGWAQQAAELQGILEAAEMGGGRLLDRALRVGLILIATFLAGAIVAMLVYRFLARRLFERAAAG